MGRQLLFFLAEPVRVQMLSASQVRLMLSEVKWKQKLRRGLNTHDKVFHTTRKHISVRQIQIQIAKISDQSIKQKVFPVIITSVVVLTGNPIFGHSRKKSREPTPVCFIPMTCTCNGSAANSGKHVQKLQNEPNNHTVSYLAVRPTITNNKWC